ncbi:hypothetical protein C0966_04295 [Bacillus methanolicus]|uniref:hypothetical protein n=1 Tax=Bacillus methanolicus TaxID=1471 RepID=UPI00237FE9B9|nr:hypothetical protein [Bacillus methanolicus]MDE3838611.1 hypothetical protein [Bacillus methanolicus]
MKNLFMCVLFTFLSLGLIACGADEKANTTNKEASADKPEEATSGKKDFEEYLNKVQPIVLEDLANFAAKFEELKNQSINGEITDIEFGQAIVDELLPTATQIQEDVEAIMPAKEIRDLHETLIDMTAKNAQALSEIVSAIESGDSSKITSANELLSEARKLERDYVYDIKEYAAKYDIEFEEQK